MKRMPSSVVRRRRKARDMPLGRRVLAYVDVMGWSELVSSRRGRRLFGNILRAVDEVSTTAEQEELRKQDFARDGFQFGHTLKVSFFSDTLVCSCEDDPDEAAFLADLIQRLCVRLLLLGRYTRGAVTVGDLRHGDGGIVVGRALIEAHHLERSVAWYPRLLVTDPAVALLFSPRFSVNDPPGPSQVETDVDGLNYLSIFPRLDESGRRSRGDHRAAREARAIVERDWRRTRDGRTRRYRDQAIALNHRAKYTWMMSYLTRVLADPTA